MHLDTQDESTQRYHNIVHTLKSKLLYFITRFKLKFIFLDILSRIYKNTPEVFFYADVFHILNPYYLFKFVSF